MTRWDSLEAALRDPDCSGAGPIQILSEEDLYDEDELPFILMEGGTVVHILADAGFSKEALAGSSDERLLIADHPEGEGWLVPDDVLADWMNRNISCPALEDLVLAHPLYEYLTKLDAAGNSRGGHRGQLIQWAPGLPNMASIYAPEFLPNDRSAPRVNRDRDAYAAAVGDLLRQLEAAFDTMEIEIGLRFGESEAGAALAA